MDEMMMAAETSIDATKEQVSNEIKPICREFLNTGKCFINKCQLRHTMNKLLATNLPEKGKPVNTEAMLSSEVDSESGSDGRPHEGRNAETRKRSGGSLDQTNSPDLVGESLPPNLVGICKPYHCGICKVMLNSLLISTAHYAGIPHSNNVEWEWQIFNNGGKIPNKRKKLDNKLLKSGKTKKTKEMNRFRCDVCKLNCEGEEQFKSHIFGKPHKKNLESVKKSEGINRYVLSIFQSMLNDLIHYFSFFCEVCKIDLASEVTLKAHQMGKNHKRQLKAMGKEYKSFFCEVCKIDLTSELILKTHQMGKNHKKQLKAMGKEDNSFFCTVCKIDLASEVTLKAHLMGKAHKKKLKEVGKVENPDSTTCDLMTSGPAAKTQYNKSLSCDVCDIIVNCEETLRIHILGKIHKKKLQKVAKEQNGNLIKSGPIVENLVNQTGIAATVSATTSPVSAKTSPVSATTSPVSATTSPVSATSFPDASAAESGVNKAVLGKNNISAINELAVKNGYLIEWTLVSQTGQPQVFTFQLEMGEHTSRGTGSNKKLAKNVAAEEMMKQVLCIQVASKGIQKKSTFSCDLCGVTSTNLNGLQAHMIGKKHLKKLKNTELNKKNAEIAESPEGGKNSQQVVPELPSDPNMDTEIVEPLTLDSKESPPDAESMLMQTAIMINENISERSVIKDEEMDDGEANDVPDLTDSIMSNLAGPSDIIKKELKITLKLKDSKLLHPAEIDKSPTSKASRKEDIVLLTENIELKKPTVGDDELDDTSSSDDDLIILENPDSLSSEKIIANTTNLNKVPKIESVKLCVYPLGQSESVTVSTQDYATLAYDTFLNDIIIDFYLLYLANNVLSNSDKDKVHIFSTMFYKRLMQSPRADAKKVPEYENDATLTSAEIRHLRVASWTKNVDLFEKDMIIIPICEESHWFLLLVIKPGIIFFPFEMKERGDPFMIVLDSVGGRKNTAVKNIRRYLACEWNKKKCDGAEGLARLEKMGKKMNTVRPNKPEQENNSDCGIFLLQYVDKVFQNVSAFLWPFLVNSRTREWFTSEEVAGKRGEIAQLIKRLTKEQKPGQVIEYPNIKFTQNGL